MSAESEHRAGEEGVLMAKHYLDCTTYVNITFSVYDDQIQTTLTGLGNTRKIYDLTGFFLGDNRRPLYVEVKNYNYVGNQPGEYTEYLANAYSITANAIHMDLDKRMEFMWVTWHPFSQTKWSQLTTEGEIRAALQLHPDKLGGCAVDDPIIRLLVDRL